MKHGGVVLSRESSFWIVTLSIPEGLVIEVSPMMIHDCFFVFMGYFEAAAATVLAAMCVLVERALPSKIPTW